MGREGSSSSDSGGGWGVAGFDDDGVAWAIGRRGTAFGAAIGVASISALGASGLGVSSTVECFPVVQGGMDMNSSKVRTRGLQHSQPRFFCK